MNIDKNSKCKICQFFIDNSFDEKTIKYANGLIKSKTPLDALTKETKLNFSKYLINKHFVHCLKDFVIDNHSQKSIKDNLKSNKDKDDYKVQEQKFNLHTQNLQKIDMVVVLENYRKMNFQERSIDCLEKIREINYLCLVSVHHQLLHGRSSSATVPKEDIMALKNVLDILQDMNTKDIMPKVPPSISFTVCDCRRKKSEFSNG